MKRASMGNFNEQVATGAAVVALLFLGLAAYNSASAGSRPAVQPQVRVNQVGYTPDSPKVAFAMLTKPAASVAFTVSSRSGPVYRGRSRTNVGPWNSRYPAVFKLDFTSLARTGQYHIAIRTAGATVVSPPFRIASARSLYHPLVRNAVQWFTSERDGPDVVRSVMHRRPANLTDEHAYVYATPKFLTSGRYSDDLVPPLRRIGGPVDVAGSWFDAGGGYERFAYTASYADALMMIADRDAPGVYPTLASEARFGLSSLEKMWDPVHKVLYIQVGIGNGSRPTKKYPAGLVQGDYNFWFLPQAEDRMNVTPSGHLPYGPTAYYVKYRPVFEAAPPGQRIDPDFAGRFAADFALGAQLDAAHQHVAAQRLLALARGVYAMAKTSNVGQIITTYP
ncbi:MAG TPA: glycoside hydrolase family 9 protein, partial [Streptosporangiaceae bacterium]|nr:glycoside hydrolase family 9 protein [Streptosporangiaceae bacterium]